MACMSYSVCSVMPGSVRYARSGMEVLTFLVPLEIPINKALSMSLPGAAVGTQSWKEVAGPDSLALK